MANRKFIIEYLKDEKKGIWEHCQCKVKGGKITAPNQHRLRELHLEEVTVKKKEWV